LPRRPRSKARRKYFGHAVRLDGLLGSSIGITSRELIIWTVGPKDQKTRTAFHPFGTSCRVSQMSIRTSRLRTFSRWTISSQLSRQELFQPCHWISPNKKDSEHPSAKVSAGQSYVTRLVNAIMQGPEWNTTAIFLSWDDWGGFYDHPAATS
jgi:phospholipase C